MFSALTSVWGLLLTGNRTPWSLSAPAQTSHLFCKVQYFHACCRWVSWLCWTNCSVTVFGLSEFWARPFSQDMQCFIKNLSTELVFGVWWVYFCGFIWFFLSPHSINLCYFFISLLEWPKSSSACRNTVRKKQNLQGVRDTVTSFFSPQRNFMHLLFWLRLGTQGNCTQFLGYFLFLKKAVLHHSEVRFFMCWMWNFKNMLDQ